MKMRIKTYHYKIIIILLLVSVPPFLIVGFYNMNTFLGQSIDLTNSKNENELVRTGVFLEKTLDQIMKAVYSEMTDGHYSKTQFVMDKLEVLDSLIRFIGRSQYKQYFDQVAYYNEDKDYLLLSGYGIMNETQNSFFQWLKDDIAAMDNYQIKVTETRSLERDGQKKHIVSIIAKLPVFENQSYLIFNIDVEKIYDEYLHGINENDRVYNYYLTNAAGHIVFAKDYKPNKSLKPEGQNQTKKSDQIVVNNYKLGTIGWNLVSEVNVYNLYHNVYKARDRMIAILVVITLMIVAIILLLARQLYKPVKTIISKIGVNRNIGMQSEFDFIHSVFEDYHQINNHLHHRLNDSQQLLKKTLVRNLVKDRFSNSADIHLHLKEYQTNLVVVIFTIRALMELDETNLILQMDRDLSTSFDTDFFIESDREFVVLFRLPHQDINRFITEVFVSLDERIMDKLTVSIGGIYSLEKINNSYIEALYAYNMGRIYSPENPIYCYNKLPMDYQHNQMKEPTIDELELAIRQHDKKAYTDLLNTMFSENKSVMEYNGNLYMCISLLIRLFDQESVMFLSEINEVITDLGMMNATSIKQFLLSKFNSFNLDYQKEFSDYLKNNYVEKVEVYFAEHYATNFSMDDVAEHVGVTRQHISQVFKKRYNTTMIDYLSQYRIEQAKRRLADTQMKITDIGSQVGFNSKSYFTKVFKLNTGITPTEYRELAWNRLKEVNE